MFNTSFTLLFFLILKDQRYCFSQQASQGAGFVGQVHDWDWCNFSLEDGRGLDMKSYSGFKNFEIKSIITKICPFYGRNS